VNGDQDAGDNDHMDNSIMATRGQGAHLNEAPGEPHVAKKKRRKTATRGQSADVVNLAAVRAKRQKTQQAELATRGQKLIGKKTRKGAGNWYVEPVKASAGTWAFRLRRREDGRRVKPIYISRVSDAVYQMIREGDYDSFKEQLVASHMPGAVRAGHRA
jgi:hypothetical protein